jgi:hypothetical protein
MLAGTLPFVGRTDDLIVRHSGRVCVPDRIKVRPEVPNEMQVIDGCCSHRRTALPRRRKYETLRVTLGNCGTTLNPDLGQKCRPPPISRDDVTVAVMRARVFRQMSIQRQLIRSTGSLRSTAI